LHLILDRLYRACEPILDRGESEEKKKQQNNAAEAILSQCEISDKLKNQILTTCSHSDMELHALYHQSPLTCLLSIYTSPNTEDALLKALAKENILCAFMQRYSYIMAPMIFFAYSNGKMSALTEKDDKFTAEYAQLRSKIENLKQEYENSDNIAQKKRSNLASTHKWMPSLSHEMK
jgi:hypothetical protein